MKARRTCRKKEAANSFMAAEAVLHETNSNLASGPAANEQNLNVSTDENNVQDGKERDSDSDSEDGIDCLVQAVDRLKSELTEHIAGKPNYAQTPNYESLYLDSTRMIDVLTKANSELNEKLKLATEKIGRYSKIVDSVVKMKKGIAPPIEENNIPHAAEFKRRKPYTKQRLRSPDC